MDTYKVYVKTDEADNIIAVNSYAFLYDTGGWTQIEEGCGDRYHHAQGNYFDKPITTDGVYRYKLINGESVEKTSQEIASEVETLPPPPPTRAEEIAEMRETLNALLGVE